MSEAAGLRHGHVSLAAAGESGAGGDVGGCGAELSAEDDFGGAAAE